MPVLTEITHPEFIETVKQLHRVIFRHRDKRDFFRTAPRRIRGNSNLMPDGSQAPFEVVLKVRLVAAAVIHVGNLSQCVQFC